MEVKKLLGIVARVYSDIFDPLLFQKRYAHNTLNKKRITVEFDKIDPETIRKIKGLWGKKNGWFDFYYTVGDKSRGHLYFPDDWFFDSVDASLNDWRTCKAIDDKGMYDLYFADVKRPKTIARCCGGLWLSEKYEMIDLKRVLSLCDDAERVIIKPSISSSGGRGIVFWQKGQNDLTGKLNSFSNCVVEEILEQHDDLNAIHAESINTIRIMTMLLDGEVHILSSILRMGVGDSKVDNVSSGGLACGINEQGKLKKMAFGVDGSGVDKHPQGPVFEGLSVPGFDACKTICKTVAPRFARFSRLVSWDFAIDKSSSPLLIEANLCGGELDFHQMCNGPIFGDEATTKEMINRFYKKH